MQTKRDQKYNFEGKACQIAYMAKANVFKFAEDMWAVYNCQFFQFCMAFNGIPNSN